jgi:hypothetical protein
VDVGVEQRDRCGTLWDRASETRHDWLCNLEVGGYVGKLGAVIQFDNQGSLLRRCNAYFGHWTGCNRMERSQCTVVSCLKRDTLSGATLKRQGFDFASDVYSLRMRFLRFRRSLGITTQRYTIIYNIVTPDTARPFTPNP